MKWIAYNENSNRRIIEPVNILRNYDDGIKKLKKKSKSYEDFLCLPVADRVEYLYGIRLSMLYRIRLRLVSKCWRKLFKNSPRLNENVMWTNMYNDVFQRSVEHDNKV